jgi:hypothetical protein
MPSYHSNKRVVFLSCFILGVFVFLEPVWAWSAENGRQPLAFAAGPAIAGLKLNPEDPVSLTVSTAPRFSLSDVHLFGKKILRNSQMPELEPVEAYGSFFGLKVTLQLKGGWNIFSGGDIENGILGMYDQVADAFTLSGVPILENQREPNHTGLEFGGDLIYCLTPRFGVGIGMSRINTKKQSVLRYEINSTDYDTLRTRPEIKISVLRLSLFYAIPFAGRLAISLHGGPALYSAEYIYSMALTSGAYGMDIVQRGFIPMGMYQEASAKQMGLEGGIGFEFNANPFVAFFIEALGRYARIGGFEGEERVDYYRDFRFTRSTQEGPVYLVYADQYPLLDVVPPEGTAAEGARKAALDFSGVSFSAGLKLRF